MYTNCTTGREDTMKTTDAQHGRTGEIRTRSAETLSSQTNSEIRLPSAKTTAGHHLEPVQRVAAQIAADGGDADAAQVDALDEQAVEKYASAIAKKVGAIEISFNSIGIPQQGILMTGTVANLTGGRVAELGTESQLEAPR